MAHYEHLPIYKKAMDLIIYFEKVVGKEGNMKKEIFCVFLSITLILGIVTFSHAGMQSPHYRIPTSVLSGGGVPATSQNYQTETTVGQPSPLTAQELLSEQYALYCGFWYAVEGIYGVPMPWLPLLLDDEQEMESW